MRLPGGDDEMMPEGFSGDELSQAKKSMCVPGRESDLCECSEGRGGRCEKNTLQSLHQTDI